MADRYYLARFTNAQDMGVYDRALGEIKNGRKMSHRMWFVFPQLRGIAGHSRNTWFMRARAARSPSPRCEPIPNNIASQIKTLQLDVK